MLLGPVARLLLAALTLARVGAAHAAEAPLPEPYLLSRFFAGAGLFAPPGVGTDGSIWIGTGDGYLHALAPDGRYRWSYTVQGRIVAAPRQDPATGRVFVATSEARLYCFEPDSRLRWTFHLPVSAKSEVALNDKGTAFFVGTDDHLYGVTSSGAMVLRLAAPRARSSPVMLADGRLALVLGEEWARIKGYGWERSPLPAAPSGAKWALSARGALLSCDARRAIVHGARAPERSVASECLQPPVEGDAFVAVAEAGGAVRLHYRGGEVTEIALGATPLRPVWDAPRRRLVLASVDGAVRVYELPVAGGKP